MEEISLISQKKKETCAICGKIFVPRISAYTLTDKTGKKVYLCSFSCKEKYLEKDRPRVKCDFCDKEFPLIHNYQKLNFGKKEYYFCSTDCQFNFILDFKRKTREASGIKKATDTTRKIIIYTQKGGTGKTTTALNVSVALSLMGYKTLLIDGDPQGNISISLKIKETENQKNIYHIFSENIKVEDSIVTYNDNLDLMLSDQGLAAINIYLARNENRKTRHKIFASRLKEVENRYDYIIIDCSPALSIVNLNLLYAANEIIIPVSCDYLSFATVDQVMSTLKDMEKYYKHRIEILGILPTFYIAGRKISKKIVRDLQVKYGSSLILSPIKDKVDIRNAAFKGIAVVVDPRSKGYIDYQYLAETIYSKKRIKRDIRMY